MTDQTPRTEAGRDVLMLLKEGIGLHEPEKHILAIEAQARTTVYAADHKGKYRQGAADERKRIADAVRALDFRYVDMDGDGTEPVVSQAAVLAILTETER